MVSVRPGQTLPVDVSFKHRYDALAEVTMMVTVRLDLNPEVIMDFWVLLPTSLIHHVKGQLRLYKQMFWELGT